MGKEVLSDKQGMIIVTLFIVGDTVVFATGLQAGKDLWISILLAMVLSIPPILVYIGFHMLFPEKNLFEMLEIILGKVLGKLVTMLFVFFASWDAASILRGFSEFINTIGLPETPKVVPTILLIALCAIVGKSGLEVLGRMGELFFPIISGLVFFAILLLIPNMEMNNLQPIMEQGIKPVVKGAISVLAFSFGELIICTMAFSHFQHKNAPFRVYLGGLLIGGVLVFATSLAEVLVLGSHGYALKYFPSYAAVSRINIGQILQRLEIIVAITFLCGGFIKLSLCLLGIFRGVQSLFHLTDYRVIIVPVALSILNLSILLYEDMMHVELWAGELWTYFALPFQVFLPIFIITIAIIKSKNFRRKEPADE